MCRLGFDGLHFVYRNDRYGLQHGIIQTLCDRIFHQRLLQLETGAGHGQILVALRDFSLRAHHVHGGNAFQLQLLPGVVERLLGKREGLLIYLHLLVRAHKIPVDVFDLRDGRDHLIFEGDVGNFLVVLRNVQVAQVGTKAETCQQFLLDLKAERGTEGGREIEKRAVGRLPRVAKGKVDAGSRGKGLREICVHLHGIQL